MVESIVKPCESAPSTSAHEKEVPMRNTSEPSTASASESASSYAKSLKTMLKMLTPKNQLKFFSAATETIQLMVEAQNS